MFIQEKNCHGEQIKHSHKDISEEVLFNALLSWRVDKAICIASADELESKGEELMRKLKGLDKDLADDLWDIINIAHEHCCESSRTAYEYGFRDGITYEDETRQIQEKEATALANIVKTKE